MTSKITIRVELKDGRLIRLPEVEDTNSKLQLRCALEAAESLYDHRMINMEVLSGVWSSIYKITGKLPQELRNTSTF